MSTNGINTTCTEALRALERAGVIGPKWRDGRLMANGCRILAQLTTEPGVWYVADPVDEGPDCRIVYQEHMTTHLGWVIDLSEAREAASLILPVREAWGDETCHTVPLLGVDAGVTRIQWMCWLSGGRYIQRDTEVEALVAALVAKAREVAP